jgi:hypothetical protein
MAEIMAVVVVVMVSDGWLSEVMGSGDSGSGDGGKHGGCSDICIIVYIIHTQYMYVRTYIYIHSLIYCIP